MKKNFFFNTKSPAYRRAMEDCQRVAASNVNVLLIGESGSGKTTLLNIQASLDRPTSGEVLLEGKNIVHLTEKEISKMYT